MADARKTLDIVEGVIGKLNELGPHRKAALRKWVAEEYKVGDTTAYRYIRLARHRLLQLTGKSAEEHTARFLGKLHEIIYNPDATDRTRISAIDKACLLLGLYRGHVQAPQHNPWTKLTPQNTTEALEQDEHPDPVEVRPDGESGEVSDTTPPTPTSAPSPDPTPDTGASTPDSSTPGETR